MYFIVGAKAHWSFEISTEVGIKTAHRAWHGIASWGGKAANTDTGVDGPIYTGSENQREIPGGGEAGMRSTRMAFTPTF